MKRRAYLLLFVLFLNSLWLLRPSPAYACSCVPPQPPADAFSQSDAVFTGRVTGRQTPIIIPVLTPLLARLLPNLFFYHSLRYSLAVTDSWKGADTTQVTVVTGLGGGDCGYSFETGKEYLVYAHQSGNNWTTNICTRTDLAASPGTADDFTYLATQSTLPLTTPFPWFNIVCGLALFILVATTGIGWRIWRKRKRESEP
jgi:hypothetical protein